MNAAKSREEMETDWWDEWLKADYSWSGLAKIPIAGVSGAYGERSLQEYWRCDPATGSPRSDPVLYAAGELEAAPDGSLWHIAHVPMVWPDLSTAKSNWSTEKRKSLAAIIAARIAAAKETMVKLKTGDEVVTGIDGRAQLHGTILLDPPDHPGGVSAPIHIAATRCWFPAWYADSRQIGPGADFRRAIFLGVGRFKGVNFAGDAGFDRAVFLDTASFTSATFSGDAGFTGSTFVGYAGFTGGTFKREASFTGSLWIGVANFARANCRGYTTFGGAIFLGPSSFENAIFETEVSYDHAAFEREIRFSSTKFEKLANFQDVNFEVKYHDEVNSGRMDFGKANFVGPADFTGAKFSTKPIDHSASFLGARFSDLVSFRGCGDHWVAALDEAEIKGRILIDERDEPEALRIFDNEVLPAARNGGNNNETGESLLKELEGGCRTIKVAMGAARNEIMEHRFYRYQLLARREQAGVPKSERMISHIFDISANYGLSLTKPLIGLFILVLVFTIIYSFFWNATGQFSETAAMKSVEMAASRLFPFGAFEDVSKNWFKSLEERGAYHYTIFSARIIGSIQSLISLVLIFLFGLGVRRRFKVGE